MTVLAVLASVFIAYLMGSLPFAYLATRAVGKDIRSIGTGNPGAANVFRAVNRRLGFLVFLADAGKGVASIIVAMVLGVDDLLLPIVGASAVVGHWRPPLPRLRGGAGLATATGAAMALSPVPGAIALPVGLIALATFRSTGHSAAIGLLALAITGYAIRQEWGATSGAIGLAAMVFLRNIMVGIRSPKKSAEG